MTSQAVAPSSSRVWLYNPWLDMIVGCGAWSGPLLLLTYFATDSSTIAWSAAFYFLALFFNFPHYMATIYRAYGSVSDFHKYRAFTLHVTDCWCWWSSLLTSGLVFCRGSSRFI